MKSVLFASAIALASVFSVNAAMADNASETLDRAFGKPVEMVMGGTTMHIRAFVDPAGGQWILMSRAEAEKMTGHKFDMKYQELHM